jgi:hypothetical protein
MHIRSIVRAAALAVAGALLLGPVAPAGAAVNPGARTAAAHAAPRPSTPQLISAAEARGAISAATATLYRAYALVAPEELPAAYRSDTPYDGTSLLLQTRQDVKAMKRSAAREEAAQLLAPDPGSYCDVLSPSQLPDNVQTPHFYIEYSAAALTASQDGLDIDDFVESLEHAWTMEITRFGWARVPQLPAGAPPGGRYHVRIEPSMAPVLYGFVSNLGKYAGEVGDNPFTSWTEPDAQATCMGLNNDYSQFPGSPRRALDATTAHEFNHSIQFGYGAITGDNAPDLHFVEGMATWMEDEAYDSSNDNYNYLWPDFTDDMGEHEDSEYSYWITWRGITERFGASVAGGGERVLQRFWEIVSKEQALGMGALNQALKPEGVTLKDAYHAFAIAAKFNRACGGGSSYPHCFQEGPQYINGDGTQTGAGPTEPHGQVDAVGGSFAGTVADNYALNWIELPATGSYRVFLANGAAGGALRLSVVCDLGNGLRIKAAASVATKGKTVSIGAFSTTGCQGRPVAVITNQAQDGANPSSSADRAYTVSVKKK